MVPGMTAQEARGLQRIYQRKGYITWRTSHIFSGHESEGFRYFVVVLGQDGKEHTLEAAHERVGGTRTIII